MLYCSFSTTQGSFYPSRKKTRLRQRNTSSFSQHTFKCTCISKQDFSHVHMHRCTYTPVSKLWFEYIPVSVCLPVQRKKFSSWLALQLWKSLFCTSSFLKKQLLLVSKCGLQISSISIPQTVDQMSQGHHGMFEIWNTATFDICQALQTTSLMLLNFNMIALHPFDDVISLPSWVLGWLLW